MAHDPWASELSGRTSSHLAAPVKAPPSSAICSARPQRLNVLSRGLGRMAAAKLGVSDSRESGDDQFQEHLYKVLVIGDFGVGKLNLIYRMAALDSLKCSYDPWYM